MEKTDTITLNAALAKVQSAVLAATKDGKNPHFGSKYATLAEVLDTVRAPLAQNGFALLQDADTDLEEGNVGVVTRLLHESGGEIASRRLSAPLRPEFTKDNKELKPSVQQIGAMVTYLRRYSLCSFLSVAVEDDDGNEAAQRGAPPAPPKDTRPPTTETKPNPNRRSAHTGQPLDTPEAVAAHKAAAQQSRDATDKPANTAAERPAAEGGAVRAAAGVDNRDLAETMFRDRLTKDGLEGYLRGTLGNPKISKPLLVGSLGINTLGAPIVAAMLRNDNWKLICERIHADEAYQPF